MFRFRRPTSPPPCRTCRPCLEALEDRTVPTTFTVVNTADSGAGSFRQAILDANANPGADTITFDIGTGRQTISPASPLPNITDAVNIDGTSQPGFAEHPIIELTGLNAGVGVDGLRFVNHTGSTLRGLVVNGFGGSGVVLSGGGAHVIQGNYIGTNGSGSSGSPPSGIVSWWKAEGNAEDAVDGNDGTLVGDATFAPGMVGQAFQFDGNGDYMTVPDSTNLDLADAVTLEAWINPASLHFDPAWSAVIAKSDVPTYGVNGRNYGLWIGYEGSIGLEYWTSSHINQLQSASGLIPVGTFSHVTGVIDPAAGRMEIYCNGTLVASRIISDPLQVNDVPLTIGASDPGFNFCFDGQIDEPTVYNRGLTAAEILSRYQSVASTLAIPNQGNGISITNGSQFNTIGGTTAAARNIISGNGNNGIDIANGGNHNLIQGNYIGTDVTGMAALGNYNYGINVVNSGGHNTIGGTVSGARNVVSGNTLEIHMVFGGGNDIIQGNYIGIDSAGTALLGGEQGINIYATPGVIIGGSTPGTRNVIKQMIITLGDGALVQGNYIGTNATGTAVLGEGLLVRGIYLAASNCAIGGTAPGAGNVIAALTTYIPLQHATGIHLAGGHDNIIQGNYIGTNPNGDVLGCSGAGIHIEDSYHNTIGGTSTGAGNTLAFCGLSGVFVNNNTSTGNSIRGNVIHDNNGLGIDLSTGAGPNGATPNDPGDADVGPNNLQNFPVLATVIGGATTQITGTLSSTPNSTFTLDFYANAAADPSGYGEGQRYLGSATVTTNANGTVSFNVTLSATISTAEWVTGTATDVASNTSEFSSAIQIQTNAPPTAHAGGPYTAVRGGSVTLDASASVDPDQANTTLAYAWDFDGDGQYDDATGMNPVFPAAGLATGSYTIGLQVTDDGGLNATTTTSVQVVAVALLSDPANPGTTALYVGGTSGNDTIIFSPSGNGGDITVSLNGMNLGTYHPTGRIVAYGQAGNDDLQVAGGISLTTELNGGDGNDRLKGGAGNDILRGGDGADLIAGGQGRDIIIGGTGSDRLVGDAEDDILIAGSTAFDADRAALSSVLAEWTSSRSYAIRVANILGTGSGTDFTNRLNGNTFLRPTDDNATVYDDGAADVLTGSAGQDWFIFNASGSGVQDRATDLHIGEDFTDLDIAFIIGL